MQLAETVTFGGGGMARHADMRGDEAAVAQLAASGDARALAIWRGKVLVSGQAQPSVVRLPFGKSILDHAADLPIFLGIVDGAPIFAHDISGWQPDDLKESEVGFFDTSQVIFPGLPAENRFSDLREVMAQLTPLDAELAASAKALFAWHVSHGYCANCGQETAMSMAGWQRHCAACQTSHFPRTDPVVIMLITCGNNVLLGRSHNWPKAMYSLLAGFVEPGETLENAVRREVLEEAGIQVGAVSYLASQPWPFPASLMVGCRGEAMGDAITIDPVEIEAALWLSREALMEAFAGRNADILPARRGSIAQFLLENWLADRLD